MSPKIFEAQSLLLNLAVFFLLSLLREFQTRILDEGSHHSYRQLLEEDTVPRGYSWFFTVNIRGFHTCKYINIYLIFLHVCKNECH